MSTYSLVYASTAIFPSEDSHLTMVEDILAKARRSNAAADITGALLFTEGKFVQALEGDRATVHATFDRVAADPRHTDIEVLSAQFADRRRFKEWSMAFVGESAALRAHFAEAPLATLGSRPAGDALLDFMLELARATDES